ncbi:hypothetical protein CO045_03775 [Candidatus Peregrinibacteria bacterium CG_4_9_14_0_2_um_filter_41_14]|nr:MAG: hypothetical protein COY06_05855 [Candidatus Peregrinibacteria bacterium CG_4_10_14_0_2_um_filter_41_8]PJC37762.1 MAG: hypothetical protein CO045_03775 [Candidatus Peregrinibacteria bacterium CG_4_9_14_0_2_um_filter_41_14]
MSFQDKTAHTYYEPETVKDVQSQSPETTAAQERLNLGENITDSLVSQLNTLRDANTYPKSYKEILITDLNNKEVQKIAGINEISPADFSTIHDFVERLQCIVGVKDDGFYGNQTSNAVKKYLKTVDTTKSSIEGLSARERLLVSQYLGGNEGASNFRVVKNEGIGLLKESIMAFTDDFKTSDLPNLDQAQSTDEMLAKYIDPQYTSLLQPGTVVYLPPGTFVIMNYNTNKLMFATNKINQDQLTTLSPQDFIVKNKFNTNQVLEEKYKAKPTEKGSVTPAQAVDIDNLIANANHEIFESPSL